MQDNITHEDVLLHALANAQSAYDKSGTPGRWFRLDHPAVEGTPDLVEVSNPPSVAVTTAETYVKANGLDSMNPTFCLLVDDEVFVVTKEPEGWRAYGSEGLIEHLLG